MKKLLFILIPLLCTLYGTGQPRSLRFDNYTAKNGLSENNVYVIFKDSRGFMWFGTDEGLNRFDGNTFRVYKQSAVGDRRLPGNRVRSISEESSGKLLIGFEHEGLCLLDVHTDAFVRCEIPRKQGGTTATFNVYDIKKQSDSAFFIATDFGVQLFSTKKGFYGKYTKGNASEGGLSSDLIRSIHLSSSGFVWVAHHNGYVDKIDPVKHKLYSYHIGNAANLSLAEDSYGNIWVGTEGEGISRISTNGTVSRHTPDTTLVGTLSDSVILSNCIVSDNLGRIWIGTNKNGLNELSQQNGDENTYFFIKHRTDKTDKLSIADNTILSLFFDGEGILWTGHQGGGVSKVQLYPKRFSNIALSNLNPKSKNVQAICPLPNGEVWIGTQTGGAFSYNSNTTKSLTELKNDGDYALLNYEVTSITADAEGNKWIGTNGDGLIYIAENNSKASELMHTEIEDGGFPHSHIVSVVADTQQNIWVATPTKLYIKVASSPLFKEMNIAGFRSDNILKIRLDKQNCIWVCTQRSGAFYSKPSDNSDNQTFTQIPPATDTRTGVSHRTVYDMAQGLDGRIWLATGGGGVTVWNKEDGTAQTIGERDGLPTGIIRSIIADKNGKIWLSTHRGIVSIASERIQIFNQEDGLLSDNFIAGASAIDEDGRIYFGADIGLISFRPDQIVLNYVVPRVTLNELRIFNTPVPMLYDTGRKDLLGPLDSKNHIRLSYRDYVFSIEFSAIDLNTPGKCKYQYQLVGFDEQWIHTDANNRIATYTNLRDGDYVFMVKAANGDGVWSKTPTSISIEIMPPYWETLWFKLLISCIVILIVFIIIKRSKSKTAHRHQELEHLISARTRQLEMQKIALEDTATELRINNATKDRFFEIIAHDLKSPFNAFIGFTTMLRSDFTEFNDKEKMRILDIISQSATSMSDLLGNLLDWARSQSKTVECRPETINLRDEAETVLVLFQSLSVAKKINLNNNISPDINILFDKNQLSAILRNLLSNSIKFTNSKGEIHISADINDEYVEISLSDNGVGMTTEQQNNLFKLDQCQSTYGTENERGTGLGLAVVKEFVEINKGRIQFISKKDSGTTVILQFPIV